jgi:hypothetical protein
MGDLDGRAGRARRDALLQMGATKLEHREHLPCHPVVPCRPATLVTRDWSFRPTSVRSGLGLEARTV